MLLHAFLRGRNTLDHSDAIWKFENLTELLGNQQAAEAAAIFKKMPDQRMCETVVCLEKTFRPNVSVFKAYQNQENGAGKQWSLHASLISLTESSIVVVTGKL